MRRGHRDRRLMPVDEPLVPGRTSSSPGRRCLVVGGGPVARRARSRGLLECGADVHVVAPRSADEVARPAGVDRASERPVRARATSAGYRLVDRRHRRSGGRTGGVRRRRGGRRLGQQRRRPGNCSFTLPARVRRGPLAGHVRPPAGHSPAAGGVAAAPARRRVRARVRDPARAARRGARATSEPRDGRPRASIGKRRSTRECST